MSVYTSRSPALPYNSVADPYNIKHGQVSADNRETPCANRVVTIPITVDYTPCAQLVIHDETRVGC